MRAPGGGDNFYLRGHMETEDPPQPFFTISNAAAYAGTANSLITKSQHLLYKQTKFDEIQSIYIPRHCGIIRGRFDLELCSVSNLRFIFLAFTMPSLRCRSVAAFAIILLQINYPVQAESLKPPPPPAPRRAVAAASPSHKSSGRVDILTRPAAVHAKEIGAELSVEHIDFGAVPLCIAGARFVVLSLAPTVETPNFLTVRDLSTSHPDFYAGLPDDKPLNMTATDSLEIQVIVLPSRLGELSGVLYIKTTDGLLTVSLSALGMENRYRVRPVFAQSVALGGKLDVRIPLFNPSSEPLAITEVFTTDEFITFHVLQSDPDGVQLCSSASSGNVECVEGSETHASLEQLPLSVFQSRKWLLPGRQTAHIVRVLARKDTIGTFTGFIHIHTSADNLIIPVQLTVVRDGVVFAPSVLSCPSIPSHTASFMSAWNADFPNEQENDELLHHTRMIQNVLFLTQANRYSQEGCFAVLNKIGRLVQANLIDGLSSRLLSFFTSQSAYEVLASDSLLRGCGGLSVGDLVAPSGSLDTFASEVDEKQTAVLHLLNAGEDVLQLLHAEEKSSDGSLVSVKRVPRILAPRNHEAALQTSTLLVSCHDPPRAETAARQSNQLIRSSLHIGFNHSSPLHSLVTVPVVATTIPGALLFKLSNTQIDAKLKQADEVHIFTERQILRQLASSLNMLQTQRGLESWATQDRLGTVRRAVLHKWFNSNQQERAAIIKAQSVHKIPSMFDAVIEFCSTQSAIEAEKTFLERLSSPCLWLPTNSQTTNSQGEHESEASLHSVYLYNGFKSALSIIKVAAMDPRMRVLSEQNTVPMFSFAAPVRVDSSIYFDANGHTNSMSALQQYMDCLPRLAAGEECETASTSTPAMQCATEFNSACSIQALLLQHTITLLARILLGAGVQLPKAPCAALACGGAELKPVTMSGSSTHQSPAQQSLMELLENDWGQDLVWSAFNTTIVSSTRGWDQDKFIVPTDASLNDTCFGQVKPAFVFTCTVLRKGQHIGATSHSHLSAIDRQHVQLLLDKMHLLEFQNAPQKGNHTAASRATSSTQQDKIGSESEFRALAIGVRHLADWPVYGDVSVNVATELLVQTNVSTFKIPVQVTDGTFTVYKRVQPSEQNAVRANFLLQTHSSEWTRPVGWASAPKLRCSAAFWQQRLPCKDPKGLDCSPVFAISNSTQVCGVDASSRVQSIQSLLSISLSEQLRHVGTLSASLSNVSTVSGSGRLTSIKAPVILARGTDVHLDLTLFSAKLLQWGLAGDTMLDHSMKQVRAGNQAQLIMHDAIRLTSDIGITFIDASLSIEPFHVLASISSANGGLSSTSLHIYEPNNNSVSVVIPPGFPLHAEVFVNWQVLAANKSQLFSRHTWKADDAAGARVASELNQLIAEGECLLSSFSTWLGINGWLPDGSKAKNSIVLQVAEGHVEAFRLTVQVEATRSLLCEKQMVAATYICLTLLISFILVLFLQVVPVLVSSPRVKNVQEDTIQVVHHNAIRSKMDSAQGDNMLNITHQIIGGLQSAQVSEQSSHMTEDSSKGEPRSQESETVCTSGVGQKAQQHVTDIVTSSTHQQIVPRYVSAGVAFDASSAGDQRSTLGLVLSAEVVNALQALNPGLSSNAIIQKLKAQVKEQPKDIVSHCGEPPSTARLIAGTSAVPASVPAEAVEAFTVPPLPASPLGGRSEVPSVHSDRSGPDLFSEQAIEQLLEAAPGPDTPQKLADQPTHGDLPQAGGSVFLTPRQNLQPIPAASWDITQGLELPSALPTSSSLGMGPLELHTNEPHQTAGISHGFGAGFEGSFDSLWGSSPQQGIAQVSLAAAGTRGYSLATLTASIPDPDPPDESS